MDLNLRDKSALVCGASQGIGKAAAIELAALGANVTLFARNEERMKMALAELDNSQGQEHDFISADFSKPEEVLAALNQHIENSGKNYHILVNNTGGPKPGPIVAAEPAAFAAAYQQHLLTNQLLAQTLLEGMKAAAYGRIINVTSTSVKEPIPNLGVSNTTRWAVAGWGKTWANEVGKYGITVNTVLPGFTATGRLDAIIANRAKKGGISEAAAAENMKSAVPAQRFADPSEVGGAIAFLASPAAGYINGIVLPVDGGRTKSL